MRLSGLSVIRRRVRPASPGDRRVGAVVGVALALVAALVAAACGPTSHGARSSSAAQPKTSAATVTVAPADRTAQVDPGQPVVVSAAHGTLTSVVVSDDVGRSLPGVMSPDATRWASSAVKRYGARYTVTAKAVDSDRRGNATTAAFTTVRPRALAYPSVVPLRGETVGVGMVIRVMFSHAVGDKAATERLLKVTSAKPVVGAWHWFGDDEVHYRPQTFWPAYDKIALDIGIGRANLGAGVYGETSRHIEFQTGASMVTTVSNATKSLRTVKNGRLVMTAPVSLGKPSKPSSSGTLLIMTVQHNYTMDSGTYGVPADSPGGYRTTVQYALRLTNSGEFLHSAPWSIAQQGHVNVSHGCINVSPRVAGWFYANSHRGDVVQVVGTGHPVRAGDGWTDWRLTWAEWAAGSALQ